MFLVVVHESLVVFDQDAFELDLSDFVGVLYLFVLFGYLEYLLHEFEVGPFLPDHLVVGHGDHRHVFQVILDLLVHLVHYLHTLFQEVHKHFCLDTTLVDCHFISQTVLAL